MVNNKITLEKALSNKKLNLYSTWHKESPSSHQANLASRRLSEDFTNISTKANFKFTLKDSIFTMGSCFARRVENTLNKNGFKVPMFEGMIQNKDLFPTSITFNKYNTYSMLYELEWALNVKSYNYQDSLIEIDSNKFFDLQLVVSDSNPGDLNNILQRKQKIFSLSSEVKNAKIIILTLGLIEVWYDKQTKKYLNVIPNIRYALLHKDRFELRILNVQENIENLNKIYKLISKYNHDFKMIVTVSPVPLLETFTKNDIVVANTFSKSVLICAAHTFADSNENVDYFPSYEIATNSAQHGMFEKDLRHISENGAKHIVDTFLKNYLQTDSAN